MGSANPVATPAEKYWTSYSGKYGYDLSIAEVKAVATVVVRSSWKMFNEAVDIL